MFHVLGVIEVAFDCCLVAFVKRIGPASMSASYISYLKILSFSYLF